MALSPRITVAAPCPSLRTVGATGDSKVDRKIPPRLSHPLGEPFTHRWGTLRASSRKTEVKLEKGHPPHGFRLETGANQGTLSFIRFMPAGPISRKRTLHWRTLFRASVPLGAGYGRHSGLQRRSHCRAKLASGFVHLAGSSAHSMWTRGAAK